jgi:hypothetical protein
MKRRNQSEWETLLGEHRKSGQAEREFCSERGIGLAYFQQRRRELERQRFVEVGVPNPEAARAAELQIPGGVTLRVSW